MQDVDLSILCADFVEDAQGHLEQAEQALLLFERGVREGEADLSLVTSMLGSLHTFKGNAGMMGFAHLQGFLHELEEVLKLGSAGKIPLKERLFSALFSSLNALRGALDQLASNPTAPVDLSAEQMLLGFLAASPEENEAAPLPVLPERGEGYEYLNQKSDTVKVNFAKLDQLLNLVGELVIQRTTLASLEGRLKHEVKDRELLALLSGTSELIGKSAADLRESIMKVRMLPAATVFRRFNRLVRDLALKSGKEVSLVFEGEETELDKTVIDEIGEPLLHLIRNAVDHGIESRAERAAAGKPPAGTLTLGARHDKSHIIVYLSDDGRGLSPANLKKSALDKGLIDPQQASQLSDQEALQLVFLPGFSTSGRLTETSGRGIGLDVVKKGAESFGGVIELESVPGKGTTFSMKLPLTLAIIQALLVEVSGEIFALPLSGVLESLTIAGSQLHEASGGEIFRLRDRLLPVKRLNRFFSLPPREDDGGYLVVVESADKRGGLLVDRLLGQQEIVVKGLDDYLEEPPGISGATVLGDGTVALILDLPSLLAKGKGGAA
ncbi:chemotaxis protein CheA [Geomonas sp. Red32]|uniref:chemotaxis protein CheA n=1 Tax=Geomonas sp. Red32 TaxID=2912856 RepID=UPI00202CC6F3|nr:chemotaxis protein CheA [Geomonas sp. Red32]MCM0081106.1 chemotaxis protein CheA [Geomonas sp. Red32]